MAPWQAALQVFASFQKVPLGPAFRQHGDSPLRVGLFSRTRERVSGLLERRMRRVTLRSFCLRFVLLRYLLKRSDPSHYYGGLPLRIAWVLEVWGPPWVSFVPTSASVMICQSRDCLLFGKGCGLPVEYGKC